MRASRTLRSTLPLLSRPFKPKSIPTKLTPAKACLSTKSDDMSSLWFPRSFAHPHAPSGFSSLFKMLDDFERYTGQGGGQLASRGDSGSLTDSAGMMSAMIAPKFDVTEHDKAYQLQGELPGVPPENVVIEFTDPQTLVVRGKAERSHTEGDPSLAPSSSKRIGAGQEQGKIEGKKGDKEHAKGEKEASSSSSSGSKPKYWLSERSYGEFSRVFNFPSSVDQDKVEARFDNGVLNVTVPKVEKKGTRRIEIK
ncbi:putative heat shock protein [Podospora conica]|nr:putative heat shock protein [Schizothecium conicum]